MKISKNDPKLTAYILKELSVAEMKQIEEQIKNDPELQAEVSRLQANVLQFKKLKVSETVRLSPVQREKIFSQTEGSTFWKKYNKLASGLAVASLAVVVYVKNEADLHSSAKQDSLLGSNVSTIPAIDDTPAVKMKMAPAKAQEEAKPSEVAVAAPVAVTPAAATDAASAVPSESTETLTAETSNDSITKEPQELVAKEVAESAFVSDEAAPKAVAKNNIALSPKRFGSRAQGGAAGSMAMGSSLGKSYAAKRESEASFGAGAAMAGVKAASKMAAAPAPINSVKIETDKFSFSLRNLKETFDNDVVANTILQPLHSCFENSLSRYVQYNLELEMSWNTDHGKVSNYTAQATVLQGEQKFETELYCVSRKIPSLFKNDDRLNQLTGAFNYRLILRSK